MTTTNDAIEYTQEALLEQLAAVEHVRWLRWMEHLFECGTQNDNGTFTIEADKVARWRRQMETPYADLSEEEKDSDRNEVKIMFAVMRYPSRYQTASPEKGDKSDDAILARHKLAWEVLSKICSSGCGSFTMTVPPQDTDSDIVISRALGDITYLLGRNKESG